MSSPSEFLTFYRVIRTQPSVARGLTTARSASISAARTSQQSQRTARAFSMSTATRQEKTHTTDKKDRLDVQSDSSHAGRQSKAQNEGGHATTQTDARGAKAKAKAEHPESPVQIGMEDERGGKGH